MGELTKVSKTFTAKYDILSDVIVSPVRIEILRNLKSHPNSLSFGEIVHYVPEDMRKRNIQKHLDQLLRENIIYIQHHPAGDNTAEEKYSLTESGKVTYDKLVEIASELKAEESQTKSE
jgi:DNA-binding transcriptional ArsR family regulator